MSTKTPSSSLLSAVTRRNALRYLEALDNPTSLGLYMCLKYKDDVSACSHSIDPHKYSDPEDFGKAYIAACFLSKFRCDDKTRAKIRKDLALEKFWSCEQHLRESNRVLRDVLYGSNPLNHTVSSVFYRARDKIGQLLGRITDSFSVDHCDFGPGSSTSVPRSKAHASKKYLSTDVSLACLPLLRWFHRDMGFSVVGTQLRESSRINIVPKNFKVDRVIACEPDWNIFFQKGIGSAIRQRLKKHGLDLNFAADYHGQLAKEGSLTGSIATLDLSSASDSISTKLVEFLLPPDWFSLLNSCRTDCIEIDGIDHHLLKFSSMGNGFTFELETLIFYALAQSCIEDDAAGPVSVFGDDIIIPNDAVPLLTQVLETAGFRLNNEKSYSTGYFRESCGYHYFKGMDVKPFFLKEDLINDPSKFRFCNSVRRLAGRFYGCRLDDTPLYQPYSYCRHSISRVYFIPEGFGDGGLVEYFDKVTPTTSRRGAVSRYPHGIEGFRVRCLLPVARKSKCYTVGLLLHKLRRARFKSRDLFSTRWVEPSLVSKLIAYRRDTVVEPLSEGNDITLSSSDISWRVGVVHVAEWRDPQG